MPVNIDKDIIKLGKDVSYGHPHAKQFKKNTLEFPISLIIFETIIIILFAVYVHYDIDKEEDIYQLYPLFQDCHTMILVGFGFLMTFLKRYGWGAIGFTFVFVGMTIQWAILVMGFFRDLDNNVKYIDISLERMISADFISAAVLISFGGIIGIASASQMIIMIIFEVVFFELNTWLMSNYFFEAHDVGGSMTIHTFGAYFGLTVARILYKKNKNQMYNSAEGAEYHSDIFSMIGTCFLWLFWPSFNSAEGSSYNRFFSIVNTYLALCASVIGTYMTSLLTNSDRRLTMEHIQNATLAGGVAVGTVADMKIQPWGATVIGLLGGIVSTLGYKYLKPFLARKWHIHDTCGINNLHGMPSLIGGIAGIIQCFSYPNDTYNNGIKVNGLHQLYVFLTSLGIALIGGAITGFIMNIPWIESLNSFEYFEDGKYFEIDHPSDEEEGAIILDKSVEELVTMEIKATSKSLSSYSFYDSE